MGICSTVKTKAEVYLKHQWTPWFSFSLRWERCFDAWTIEWLGRRKTTDNRQLTNYHDHSLSLWSLETALETEFYIVIKLPEKQLDQIYVFASKWSCGSTRENMASCKWEQKKRFFLLAGVEGAPSFFSISLWVSPLSHLEAGKPQ